MPVRTPCPIAPSAAERGRLKKLAYGCKTEHRLRVRAQVVLDTAYGRSNACITPETGACHWTPCAAGVAVSPRRACPGSETANAAAVPRHSNRCRPPRSLRWPAGCLPRVKYRSHADGARNWRARRPRGIAPFMSASTVRRWLAQDALKPWQHRSWIFTTSPASS